MARATVELDFFRLGKESDSVKARIPKFLDRRRSFRDIQCAISKINPDLLKSVIESGSATTSVTVPSSPKVDQSLPVDNHFFSSPDESAAELAPLTIFYNGIVSVFAVPRDKAETVLKLASKECKKTVKSDDEKPFVPSINQQKLLETAEDLPIARRKSLKIFLEKRKERSI